MRSKNDILYIFLHIPKCAGTTFRHHIEMNFNKEEILGFYNSYNKRLTNQKFTKQKVFNTVESLSPINREKIKLIYGHEVYYGIHNFFSKPARYFTFLRSPEHQIISFYNYRMQQAIKRGDLNEKDIPSFEDWLNNSPGMHDGMLGDFLRFGFGDKTANSKESLSAILDKFYFIGITESFDEDALFLYHELGIRKFYSSQNKTRFNYITCNFEKIKMLIDSKTKQDQKLYECGLELNREFKKRRNDFSKITFFMKLKRAIAIYSRNFLMD